jgi:hypothetical protein
MRVRKLFGFKPYREMRLSGYVLRQREDSNVVHVSRLDGTTIDVTAILRAGNVVSIILRSGDKKPTY